MEHIFWILDAGHGGIDPETNKYVTAGRRSPEGWLGSQIFEGVYNMRIVECISDILTKRGISHGFTRGLTEYRDISLRQRCKTIKDLVVLHDRPRTAVVSVHLNAAGGTGFEVFTSPKQTSSDLLADCMARAFLCFFPGQTLRSDLSDGDLDKEASFTILVGHPYSAVLTENFFMDNVEDFGLLNRSGTVERIAEMHVAGMMAYERMIL